VLLGLSPKVIDKTLRITNERQAPAGATIVALLIGVTEGHPVLGPPGCARNPKENGFDWVLTRLLAGLPVQREDITGMGVGGLLMEIISRPQPRGELLHAVRSVAGLTAVSHYDADSNWWPSTAR
jgi:molybdopterin biosynthesis enzyme